MNTAQPGERIGIAVGHLLDEVFLDYARHCRVQQYQQTHPEVLFLPRPPELLSPATMPDNWGKSGRIAYPGPLMSPDEGGLFQKIAPGAVVQTMATRLEDIQ